LLAIMIPISVARWHVGFGSKADICSAIWRYCLSYQKYFSAQMVCYEGKGVPVDIKLLNKKSDIENGVDPLIICALKVLKSKKRGGGE
jgi:hypothetical protein